MFTFLFSTILSFLDGSNLPSKPIDREIEGVPLTFFETNVESIRHLVAMYADVMSSETSSLHESQAVFGRWHRQIAALRSL
jgi:hypothetical protein